MKVLLLTAFAIFGSIFFAQAQPAKKTVPAKSSAVPSAPTAENDEEWLFNKYYGYVQDQVKKGKDVVVGPDAVKIAEYFNTNPEIKARKAKIYREDYAPKNQQKIVINGSDRISLLKGIPEPKNPAAALQGDPRENEKYEEKIKRAAEQAAEEARRIANSTDLMKTYNEGGREAVQKKYVDQANKNEIVKDMGGVEALQNMSEKERQEAARKMVAKQTGGYTPEEIKKMTPEQQKALAYQMASNRNAANGNEAAAEFTKKLMSDASFRKEYEKMNDAEKQKVYQEFVQGNGLTHKEQKVTKEMRENEQEARELIEISRLQAEYRKELQALFEPINAQEQRYESSIREMEARLSKWVESETEKLPTVSDSEYGPRKDGIERVLFMEAVLRFSIGKDKNAKEREIWDRYVAAHVTAFQKLDEWIARYDKRTDLSDRLKFHLAELKATGYDAINDLNRKADYITRNAGSVQYNYNCQALQNCHDPRQDKYSAGK